MKEFNPQIEDQIIGARRPLKYCPECDEKLTIKVSFKGRHTHRIKRKTQYCSCGWSKIIPTYREALIELGLID